MDKKVFRLHEGNKDTGWFRSIKPDFSKVSTDGKKVATSIPSPFAQIDLVKSAFKWVADNGIDGKTAQHKLVSDALDIGQMFYISNRLRDKIEIVAWDPKIRMEELLKSDNFSHQALARTLSVYWEQDAEIYNFGRVNRLYFILNRHGEILGGTSPSTLFFAAPDAGKYCPEIHCGSDVLLDKEYSSLAQREHSYIEYIYSLSVYQGFTRYFDEFYSYLNSVRKELPESLQEKIHKLPQNAWTRYKPCLVQSNPGDTAEILNMPLGTEPDMKQIIREESDFLIKSTLAGDEYLPLVLPDGRFNRSYSYTSSGVMWDANSPELTVNPKLPDDSVLPFQEHQYPWLTKGNLLQDKIVRLPYSVDLNKFELAGSRSYLLPLTSTFFRYFETRQVQELCTIHEQSTGGVEVTLKIPVRGGDVTFRKIYHERDQVQTEMHLAILPFVRVETFPLKYTVGLIHGNSKKVGGDEFSVSFYEKGESLTSTDPVIRSPGEGTLKSIYQGLDGRFDLVKIHHSSFGEAFVIPKFKKYHQGNDSYKFAIDFGTTNTHIEYKISGLTENVLNNLPPLTFWASLLDLQSDPDPLNIYNEEFFEQELMPVTFGENENGFPLRTAVVENSTIEYNRNVEVFRHINNYLLYDIRPERGHLTLKTKLKWSNFRKHVEQKRVEAYIEYLLWLAYYRVLIDNGNLSNTEIVWFYPVSMPVYHQNFLESKWKQLYTKVFGKFADETNIRKVAESVAPFYFYHNRLAVLGLSVSIDVGGGSSDIAIFDKGRARLISSFRFAGDAVFGDGYGGSPTINGFINRFRAQAESYLINNSTDKLKILQHIIDKRGDSADFSSFLFSLSTGKQSPFNYEDLIKNDQNLKLSILIFYASLAYYVARLMKLTGFSIPENILFSGTGSKSLSFLDSNDYKNMSDLYEYIFLQVYNEPERAKIKIKQSPLPKEITCKGGLLADNIDNEIPVKFWIGKNIEKEADSVVDADNLQDVPKYKQIDNGLMLSVIDSTLELYSLLDNYFENKRISNIFGISRDAYAVFKEIREEDLNHYFEKGIDVKIKEEGNDADLPLAETLFFYPLVGVLNKLSFKLSELNTV
jgi:hypothetical protein